MNSPAMNHIEDELTCCICLDLFDNPVTLPCSHNLCKRCAQGLIDNRSVSWQSFDCPKCRHKVTFGLGEGLNSLPENKTLKNIVGIVRKERSYSVNSSHCSKHDLNQHQYCFTCKCTVCEKCKLEAHNGFGHNLEMVDVVLAEKQEKADQSVIELKAIQKSLTDQQKDILAKKEKINAYTESLLESVEFNYNQLLHHMSMTKKKLISSLHEAIRERKSAINDDEVTCQRKLSHVKSLIKQYKASQVLTLEAEQKIKVIDNYLLKQCSFMTFELNSRSFDVSTEQLPEVTLQGIEAVMTALDNVSWQSDTEHHTDEKSKHEQQSTTKLTTNEESETSNLNSSLCSENSQGASLAADDGFASPRSRLVKEIGKMLSNLCAKNISEVRQKAERLPPPTFDDGVVGEQVTVEPSTSGVSRNDRGLAESVTMETDGQGGEASRGSDVTRNLLRDAANSPFNITDFLKSLSDPGTSHNCPDQSRAGGGLTAPPSSQSPASAESRSASSPSFQSAFSVELPTQRPLFTLGSSPALNKGQRKCRYKSVKKP